MGGLTPREAARLLLGMGAARSLDFEGDVLLGRAWRIRALAGWLGAAPYVTVVVPAGADGAPPALAQARRRVGGGAADLVRLAPPIVGVADEGAWQALLEEACRRLGACGARRVYAAVPAGDEAALRALARAGFAAFAADVVYRRDAAPPRPAAAATLDALGEHEAERLVAAARAARERMIEGPEGDWGAYPVGGHWPGRVIAGLVAPGAGAAGAAWRVVDGAGGSWLRAASSDDAGCDRAVAAGLAAAGRSPVWASARTHQPGLQRALVARGFQAVAERRLLVRHTTRFVRTAAWREAGAAAIAPSPPVAPATHRPVTGLYCPVPGAGARRPFRSNA